LVHKNYLLCNLPAQNALKKQKGGDNAYKPPVERKREKRKKKREKRQWWR
jgi:hypothetical protein